MLSVLPEPSEKGTTVEHCETRADTLDRVQWWRSKSPH